MFTQQRAHRRADRRRPAKDGTVVDSWIQSRRRAEHGSHGGLERASSGDRSRPSTAATGSGSAPAERDHGRRPRRPSSRYHRLRVPDPRPPQLRRRRRRPARGSHPPGPGRPGHVRHQAGGRARRAGPVARRTTSAAGNYVVIDGKKTKHDYVYMHLKEALARATRASGCGPARRSASVGDTGDAERLPPALRGVVGPGLVRGRALPARRSPKHLKQWDGWS